MFRSPIVFVIGAGASKEAGLPTGAELKDKIANFFKTKFDEVGLEVPNIDYLIENALKHHIKYSPNIRHGLDYYLRAASLIHNAMPLTKSIDSFIDTHHGNEALELCGKLAIARCILQKENGSDLHFDPRAKKGIDFNKLEKTWYNSFWQILSEKVNKSEVENIFTNTSFIIFNYDRCVEQFLLNAICKYYDLEEIAAVKLLEKAKIYHPYGTVGRFSWQTKEGQSVGFGEEISEPAKFLQISQQIKTFTQHRENITEDEAIRQIVQNSKTIVFLGFAFHEQNLELLKPITNLNIQQIFATGSGISDNDLKIIEKQLVAVFGQQLYPNIKLRRDLKCADLFIEYQKSLTLL